MTELDKLLAARDVATTVDNYSTTQSKIDLLEQKRQEKINNLAPKYSTDSTYSKDVLLGMSDADTFTTKNLGYTREVDPYGNRYDAVELKHGDKPYDMQGISKEQRDAGMFGKSEYSMQKQREQVGKILGKSAVDVTEQDMIDVANQQQIQKLADVARGPGEERWEAPLIRGVEQTNLTGQYVDDKGQSVNIPLNVDVTSKEFGNIGTRGGGALGNLAGEEVSATAAVDPMQNAFADQANKQYGRSTKGLTPEELAMFTQLSNESGDGRVVSDIKNAGASAISTLAGIMDAGHDFITSMYGKEDIDTPFEKWVFKNDFLNEMKDTKNTKELLNASQKYLNKANAELDAAVDEGDILGAFVSVAKNTDVHLAESAGEMGALAFKVPGLIAAVGNRVNNDIEAYKEVHGGQSPDGERIAQMIATNAAVLGAEQLLVFKPIKRIFDRMASSQSVKGKVFDVAKSTAGEMLQETADQAQQTYNVEDRLLTKNEATKAAIAGGGVAAPLATGGKVLESVKDRVVSSELSDEQKEVLADTNEVQVDTPDVSTVSTAAPQAERSTEEMMQELTTLVQGFEDSKVIDEKQYKYAQNLRDEIRARKSAEALTSKKLGSISDIEKYLTESGIAKQDADLDIEATISDVILKHVDKEKLADIQIALKGFNDVADKKAWDTKVDEAIEARMLLDGLEDSAAVSREGVVSKGITAAPDRQGYVTYAKNALAGDEKSLTYMTDFMGVQADKIEKLSVMHEDLKDAVNAQIDSVLKQLPDTFSRADVVKAMLDMARGDKSVIPKVSNPELEKIHNKIVAILGSKAPLDVQGTQTVSYSNPHFSRSDSAGNFTEAKFRLLGDIAEDLGIDKDIEWNNGQNKSPVNRVIGYISEELQDMDRIHSYIMKTKYGKVEETKTAPTEEAPVSEDIDMTPTESNVDTTEEPKTKETKAELPEKTKKWIDEQLLKEVNPEQLLARLDASKIPTEAKMGAARYLRPIIDRYKAEESKKSAKKEEPKKEEAPKKQTFADKILAVDVEKASIAELRQWSEAKVGESNTQEVKDKHAAIKKAYVDRRKADTQKAKESEAELAKEITEIKQSIKKDREKVKNIKETASRTNEQFEKIYKALQWKKELTNKAKELNKQRQDKYDELDTSVNEMNSILTNMDMEIQTEDNSTKLIKKLRKLQEKLDNKAVSKAIDAFVAVVEAIKKEIEPITANYKAVQVAIAKVNKEIDTLKAEVEAIEDKSFEEVRAERKANKELKEELYKDINTKREQLKSKTAERNGTVETEYRLVESLGLNKDKTYANGVVVSKNMTDMLSTKKATSTLGNVAVTDEDVKADPMYSEEGNAKLMLDKLPKSKKGELDMQTVIAEHPYLRLLLDSNENINNNTMMGMLIGIQDYIAENLEALTQLTPKDADILYGENKWEADVLDYGIPMSYIAPQVGKGIMDRLGLAPKTQYKIVKDPETGKETREEIVGLGDEFYEQVSTQLGLASIEYAIASNVLVDEKMENGRGTKTVRLQENLRGNVNFKNRVKDQLSTYKEKYGLEEVAREIKTEPTVRDWETVEVHKNPYVKADEDHAKVVVKYEQTPFNVNWNVLDYLEKMGDKAKYLLGYVDTEGKAYDALPASVKDSIVGKNRQIEMELDNLQELRDAKKDGKLKDQMYFDWFLTTAKRVMIKSKGGFDPQNKKLHRFAGYFDGMKGKVKPGTISETLYKLGMAQAFGYSIDKNDVTESLKFADMILANMNEVEKNLTEGKKEFEVDGNKVEIEELSHAVLGLIEGKKYKAGKEFDTVMTVEVDGLTNGFGHKMIQYVATTDAYTEDILQDTIEWLERVGIQLDDEGNFTKKLGEGKIVDGYMTLGTELGKIEDFADEVMTSYEEALGNAKKPEKVEQIQADMRAKFGIGKDEKITKERVAEAIQALQGMLDPIVEDGKISRAVRDLLKPPFMTFNYNAGFKSMSNGLAAMQIDKVATKVVKEPNTLESNAFAQSFGFKSGQELANLLKAKKYNMIKTPDGRTFKQAFMSRVEGVYGDRVKGIMSDKFGGILEINKSITDATSVMFAVFKTAYEKKLKERGIDGVPTPKVRDEIVSELKDVFPFVKTLQSKGFEDGLGLFKLTKDKAAENSYGRLQVTMKGGKQSSVAIDRKTFDDLGVLLGVYITHNSDSAGVVEMLKKHSVLEVFDAYVIGVGQEAVAKQANVDFTEQGLSEDWSQTKAVKEALERVLANAEKAGISTNEIQKTMEANMPEWQVRSKDKPTVASVVEGITKIDNAAQARRAKLREYEKQVQQFALLKETGYTHGTKKYESMIHPDVKAVDNYVWSKENTKQEESIMSQQNSAEAAIDNCKG